MAQFPALPLWTDAYLGDTTHLTTIEHGAYLLLLIAMWRNKGTLPNDDKLLARYARLQSNQWKRMKPILMEFFTTEDGQITQGRLTDEYLSVEQHSRKQSNNSKARWLKNKKTSNATGKPKASQTDAPLPLPLPSKEETSSNEDVPISTPLEIAIMADRWNETADELDLPRITAFNDKRRRKAKLRLKDVGGLEGWERALAALRDSPFCLGENDRGWRANFDFMLQQESLLKLIEGAYQQSGRQGNGRKHYNDHGTQTGLSQVLEGTLFDEQRSEDRTLDTRTPLLPAGAGRD